MKNEKAESNQWDDLRRQAEERLKDCRSDLVGSTNGDSRDGLALVHELQVHQIELEMQNEELKHANLETEDALMKYSDLYDFAPIGLFAFDTQGLIQEINLAGAALLGTERRNLMNRLFRRFVAPEDRPFFDDFCKSTFETPTKQKCELNLIRDKVPTNYVRIEGISAEDGFPNGRLCRIAVIDITERKQAEEALLEKTAEMERFIYTISHDLRSPLVTLSGFVGLLKKDLENGDSQRAFGDLLTMNETITKMDRLLMDTLELSRIGRVINPPEDVSFDQIVQEALELVAERIRSGNVTISVAKDLPKVRVDMPRIVEVLVNLIENSMKYMGDKEWPKIEIGSRRDNIETVFFIKDNGIGIDPKEHEKVFGLFYKVERKSEGTGAGLSIVKRIIEVHGGRIWIESELGKGCTVCFTLPLT